MILAAAIEHLTACGCGESITAFLVLRHISSLYIVVDVGLVVGVIAAITPLGVAIFFVPNAVSSSITPQVFLCLM